MVTVSSYSPSFYILKGSVSLMIIFTAGNFQIDSNLKTKESLIIRIPNEIYRFHNRLWLQLKFKTHGKLCVEIDNDIGVLL